MSGNILLENTSYFDKKDDTLIISVLVVFTLFSRLFLLQMINVGPDEIDYWFAAKQLVTGGTYPPLMHRTIRWSIILPTALVQLILGTRMIVYYVTPVLNSLIQTVLLYLLGRKLFSRGTAFYAVLLFAVWPYMWRTGSQIRPAVFSLTYVLLALYGLILFLRTDHRNFLLLSVAGFFLAYESKITNIYFIPGILIILWRYRKRIKEPLLFALPLLGLYLMEHVSYWIFTGNRMGRLGIIAAYHLTGDFADKLPHGILGLFARYTSYMEFPWKLLFLAFLAATVYLLIKKKQWIPELTILHISFFFFLTFMVKGLHPVEPVEPFLDRYYIVNLPTMSLIIIYALRTVLPDRLSDYLLRKRTEVFMTVILCFMIVAVTALPLPRGAERFVTPLGRLSEHPISKSFQFERLMHEAVDQKLPVISLDTEKPLDTADRVLYDSRKGDRTRLPIKSMVFRGHTFYFLERAVVEFNPENPEQKVLWCSRFNFDMKIIKLGNIPALKGAYSEDS